MSNLTGEQKMQWAFRHMPILSAIADRFSQELPFKGLNVVVALHLEAKTANLAYVLLRGGASVAVTASNPITTQHVASSSSPSEARRKLSTRSILAKCWQPGRI
jgi:S-adenosylhomocysteine hydrolase